MRPYKGYSKVVNLPLFDPSIRLFPESREREYSPAEDNKEAADGAAAAAPTAEGEGDDEEDKETWEPTLLDDIVDYESVKGDSSKRREYMLPRHPGCISKKFIDLMNDFGNEGIDKSDA